MLFSELYKNPKSPLSKLRQSLPHTIPILPPGVDEDLVSRDKVKQKEAVKRFLADRVRNDWVFDWPPRQHGSQNVDGTQRVPKRASSEAGLNGSIRNSSEQVESNADVDPAAVKPAAAAVDVAASLVPGSSPGVTSIRVPSDPETSANLNDPGAESDSDSDVESVYSTVSEDALHYRPRADWTSDLSDDDAQPSKPSLSPFRFDTPDSVGAAVQSSLQARRTRRRREVREESIWNKGLACYSARRDAWTGARTVRVKPRATPVTSPVSPISPRRLFWRTHSRTESASSTGGGTPTTTVLSAPTAAASAHTTALSPATTHGSNHSSTLSSSEDAPPCARHPSSTSTTSPAPSSSTYPVETLLPVPAPLIPPQNPMRASITPQIYPSLYDKVVVHSLQPSCPINLSDMVASCVAGWKRDGEWPPRCAAAPPPPSSHRPPTQSVVAVRRGKKSGEKPPRGEGQAGRTGSVGDKAGAGGGGGGGGRRKSFGFLKAGKEEVNEKEGVGKDKEEEAGGGTGKGIRRSLQRVFSGLGHHHGEEGEQQVAAGKETAVM